MTGHDSIHLCDDRCGSVVVIAGDTSMTGHDSIHASKAMVASSPMTTEKPA